MLNPINLVAASSLLVAAALTTAHAAVVDGGFEPPNPTATPGLFENGFVVFGPGSSFGGPSNAAWSVMQIAGPAASVAVTSTTEYTYTAAGKTYFQANSGLQWLDLTGATDNGGAVGVVQGTATTPGTTYQLDFAVGAYGRFGATVSLLINDVAAGTFTNSAISTLPAYNGDGVAGMVWQTFTYSFTASSGTTTLGFFNGSGSGNPAVGLDDVMLTLVALPPVGVPEPASLAVLGLGLLGLASARRRVG